jgi:hypothetical protein
MYGPQSTHQTGVEEEVRQLVAELELRGYDRRTAVSLLLDIADRSRSNPPKRRSLSPCAGSGSPFRV